MNALAVLIGSVAPFGPNGVPSAIAKRPVPSANVTVDGLEGDHHGDPVRHGGPDKAVHQYPIEHYEHWRAHGVDNPLLDAPGAFGENVTTRGMTEQNVCVGDVYRVGEAGLVIQVTQVRQPCWKLNVRLGPATMAADVQRACRTGWHYRVLEPGRIAVDDAFALIERPNPAWTLARLAENLYVNTMDRDALAEIAALPQLAERLRDLARKRLETADVESWEPRLRGSPA